MRHSPGSIHIFWKTHTRCIDYIISLWEGENSSMTALTCFLHNTCAYKFVLKTDRQTDRKKYSAVISIIQHFEHIQIGTKIAGCNYWLWQKKRNNPNKTNPEICCGCIWEGRRTFILKPRCKRVITLIYQSGLWITAGLKLQDTKGTIVSFCCCR